MTAKDYPITTPYGKVAGYPLNNGFHNGIDYGCPTGTPVVVNGVTIGLSGATGYVTGAHLHVGRWVNGTVTNPQVGGGFQFNNAVVSEIGYDTTNGNYVRVQADGASWVYLHLSKTLVKVGQVLQGVSDMIENEQQVRSLYIAYWGRQPNQTEINQWVNGGKIKDLINALDGNPIHAQTFQETLIGRAAVANDWQGTIARLQAQAEAGKNLTDAERDKLVKMADDLEKAIAEASK